MNCRRSMAIMIALAACLAACALPSYGQSGRGPTRVRFKRGESSATVNGQLSGKRLSQSFLISARAGQELYVQVKGRNDSLSSPFLIYIDDPSGKSVGAGTNDDAMRIRLKQTGNYLIKVGLPHFLEGSMQQFSILVRVY